MFNKKSWILDVESLNHKIYGLKVQVITPPQETDREIKKFVTKILYCDLSSDSRLYSFIGEIYNYVANYSLNDLIERGEHLMATITLTLQDTEGNTLEKYVLDKTWLELAIQKV